MLSIIAIVISIIFSLFVRVLITRYLLPIFSITPIHLMSLFKKYILIYILIIIPLLLLPMGLGLMSFSYEENFVKNFFYESFLDNLEIFVIVIFYLAETLMIRKIIKDKSNNKIPFKIILILVLTFFLFDMLIENSYPEFEDFQYTETSDINQTIEENLSIITQVTQ